ncbi:hypothetical protein NC652_029135 [Populus alba x Populus x berolinensis]|nr:hypothetical protein NC652_029135 [Populus alba x Populus x berolinensis]
MDGTLHPLAQDSATGRYSSAAKGGAGLVLLLLAILIYILKRRGCAWKSECNVGGDSRPMEGL